MPAIVSRQGGFAAVLGFIAVLAGGVGVMHAMDMLRVGTHYAAKIVCSGVFVAGRDAAQVIADDVQAPGVAIFKALTVEVDRAQTLVRVHLPPGLARAVAVYRPGTGCTGVPDGDIDSARRHAFAPTAHAAPDPALPWPAGERADADAAMQAAVADDGLAGPGARALVVVHRGRLVAERYAPGFDAGTPLPGWSMAKTANAALVGIAIADGRLRLEQTGFWPQGDERAGVSLAHLLAMTSGLLWDEGYGTVSDVTRMLFLEADMAAYARARPLATTPATTWNYASGSSVLLARLWQDAAGDGALRVPHERLFTPLGMRSAVFEADARGTFVGSSYLHASARDWARLGLLLLQDGVWNDRRMLPEGFVAQMRSPVPPSNGEYGAGQIWLHGGKTAAGIPDDTYAMEGHDGQYVFVVPSQQLVIVRLGLTPSSMGYSALPLVAAVAKAAGG